MGYILQCRGDRKFWTITQKNWGKVIRIAGLGEEGNNLYTNEMILQRLKEPKTGSADLQSFHRADHSRPYSPAAYKSRAAKGSLYNLYLHYCYLLGYLPKYNKSPNPNRVHYLLRDDLLKLDRITEETRFLSEKRIETDVQLLSYQEHLEKGMEHLTAQRADLRNRIRRKGITTEEREDYRIEISEISNELKKLRKEVRLCESIKARSDLLAQKIEKVLEDEKRKEVKKYEFGR